jgi:hypothetical protein
MWVIFEYRRSYEEGKNGRQEASLYRKKWVILAPGQVQFHCKTTTGTTHDSTAIKGCSAYAVQSADEDTFSLNYVGMSKEGDDAM